MVGNAVVHFAIERLAGGDVGDRKITFAGEFFRQTAFAGAGAAED
jgi:hypothetical protein